MSRLEKHRWGMAGRRFLVGFSLGIASGTAAAIIALISSGIIPG